MSLLLLYFVMNFFVILLCELPYFFSYKTEFFSFQNNPKNLDKTGIVAKFHRADLVICSHSGKGKIPSYS